MDDSEIITTKDAVKALFHECGGHKAVAHILDVSLARVYAFTDDACPQHNLSVKRAAQLTTPTSTAVAQYLARKAGGVFYPLPVAKGLPAMAALGEAIEKHGKAIHEVVKAMADGKVTAEERDSVVQHLESAISASAALLAHFREEGQ